MFIVLEYNYIKLYLFLISINYWVDVFKRNFMNGINPDQSNYFIEARM